TMRGAARGSAAGFTLIELLVAMGLLTLFGSFLVQLMSTSVGLFHEGERGQDLADRADAAARAIERTLGDMLGPSTADFAGASPSARLLVQWVASGPAQGAPPGSATLVQALRAAVRIDERVEERLLRVAFAEEAREAGTTAAAVEERLAELIAAAPRHGRAAMLLVARPAGDREGAFFTVRRLLQ